MISSIKKKKVSLVPFQLIMEESGRVAVTLEDENGFQREVEGYFVLYRLPWIEKICAGFMDTHGRLIVYGTKSALPGATDASYVEKVMDKLERVTLLHVQNGDEAKEFAF